MEGNNLMGTLYTRKDSPNWWWQHGDARKSTGIPHNNRTLAEEVADEFERERLANKFGIPVRKSTIRPLAVQYLATMEVTKSEAWAYRMKTGLMHFVRMYGECQLTEIGFDEMEVYIYKRVKLGRAPKTIHTEIQMVSRFFKYAAAKKYNCDDPTRHLNDILPPNRVRNERQAIPEELLRQAVNEAWLDVDRAFWTTLYYTGLRISDAGTLTADEVRPDRIDLTQTKTKKPVVIPLHRDLVGQDIVGLRTTHDERVESRRRIQKILGGYDLHSIRHSFASHLVAKGASEIEVQVLLGHSKRSVTAQYVHSNFDRLQTLVNRLSLS
jgi:integrase/recombinase XerD|tara:strand:+ start:867 stop:1841 length:975 start_codon:yes stop_codon:yes gene_type:complete